MGKVMLKVDADEAASAMRTAQRVLDLVDEAKGEATCTTVVGLLERAHRELCVVVSFLNGGAADCGGSMRREIDPDFSEQRKEYGRNGNFLKAAGSVKFSNPGTYRRKKRIAD